VAGAALFAALRLALIASFGTAESPRAGDHGVYHLTALRLAESASAWMESGSEFGFRAPLYFAYLAAAAAVAGPAFFTSQVATCVLGVLNALLLFFLVRRVAGRAAGLIAFYARGLWPHYIVADTFALSEPLFDALLLLLLLTLTHPTAHSARSGGIGGMLGALALLTREAGVVYVALAVATFMVMTRGNKNRLVGLIAFSLTLCLTLSPWLWRNRLVWGSPLPLAHTAGVNLHIGNNPWATGGYVDLPDDARPAPTAGMVFGSPQVARWHRDRAVEYILSDPLAAIALVPSKLKAQLWPSFLRYDMRAVYPTMGRALVPLSAVCGLGSIALVTLGAWALWSVRRTGPGVFLAAVLVLNLAVAVVFYGNRRYRDPLDHAFFAAIGLARSGSVVRRER